MFDIIAPILTIIFDIILGISFLILLAAICIGVWAIGCLLWWTISDFFVDNFRIDGFRIRKRRVRYWSFE